MNYSGGVFPTIDPARVPCDHRRGDRTVSVIDQCCWGHSLYAEAAPKATGGAHHCRYVGLFTLRRSPAQGAAKMGQASGFERSNRLSS